MFAVEINNNDGKGWQIVAGPMPRAQARDAKREHVTTCEGTCRVRVVPTGEVRESEGESK